MIVLDHVNVPGRLNDVSLTIRTGARLGIIGRSGAGKSSFISVLTGQLRPRSGSVTMPENHFSLTVGYIPQDPGSTLLPHRPVSDSVLEPLRIAGKRSRKDDTAQRLSNLFTRLGLEPSLAARTPEQLSGGQRQRVAIARALLGEPELIIADEAFSALDKDNVRLLEDVLLTTTATVIFISHDVAALSRICTDMLVLVKGKVAFYGAPGELLRYDGADEVARLVQAARELGAQSCD